MTCRLETFVSDEPVEDEHGDPTGEMMILATCNGSVATACGWQKRLTEFDAHPKDWWMTSTEMSLLHAEHHAWSAQKNSL